MKKTDDGVVIYTSTYKVDGKAWREYQPWFKLD